MCRYAPEDTRHLVADTAAVSIYSEERGGGELAMPSLEGMAFSNDPVRAGEVVEKINLRYSYSAYSYWQYEAESGVYTRYQDIVEDFSGDNERFNVLRDRLNSKAIAASNVVVILVPHWHFFYRAASGSSPMVEVVDMDFSGRGQAYMFRDGMAFELEWVNDGVQLLHLVDAEGEVFPFKPGVTWFQVMSEESFFSVDGDHWRFQFVFERP